MVCRGVVIWCPGGLVFGISVGAPWCVVALFLWWRGMVVCRLVDLV